MKKILITGLLAALLLPTITKPLEDWKWAAIFGLASAGSFFCAYKFNQEQARCAKIFYSNDQFKQTAIQQWEPARLGALTCGAICFITAWTYSNSKK